MKFENNIKKITIDLNPKQLEKNKLRHQKLSFETAFPSIYLNFSKTPNLHQIASLSPKY